MKIKRITREHYKGKVYNIGVAEHHNYFANGVLVSNCYTNALKSGRNFENLVGKIKGYFEPMDMNQRPTQVAIGGAGEPTEHPDFVEAIKAFHDLEIMPNYTTNGMNVTDEVLEATKKYCGGVAISLHPHLKKYWTAAIERYHEHGIRLALHIIISDRASIDHFLEMYEQYKSKVDYFVLLPYKAVGRALPKDIDTEYLTEAIAKIENQEKLAFGAYFFDYLKENPQIKASLYPPELFSKYLIMAGSENDKQPFALYNNSFEMKTVKKFQVSEIIEKLHEYPVL